MSSLVRCRRAASAALLAGALVSALVAGPSHGLAAPPAGDASPAWDAPMGRLDPATFSNPPATSRPHAFWFWNGKLTKAELEKQLDDMQAKGVEEFFIHPRQGLGGEFGKTENAYYLSTDYFDKVGFVLRQAKARGMKAWLYDDLNWPSGYAGGRTVRGGEVDGRTVPADPELVPWYLAPVAENVTGPSTYDKPVAVDEPKGWKVVDGALDLNGGDVGLLRTGSEWTDYRFDFDLTIANISGGWTLRSKSRNDLVMVNLTSTSPYNPEANSSFGVHIRTGGGYRLVGARIPAGTTIRNGDEHRVSTEVRGDTVIVSLDGREVGRRSDPAIAALGAGTIGFRMDPDERATVDDVEVTSADDGRQLFATDFSDGDLSDWDALLRNVSPSLVAAVALPKRQTGSCVTGGQARGVQLEGAGAVELTGRVQDGRLTWDVPAGEWCLLQLVQRPLVNYHPDLEPDEPYVDMLNPAATEKFIDITHETYAERFGPYFGSTIQGIFNDEPGFYNNFPDNRGGLDSQGSIPWTPGFRDYLAGNAGYDLTKDLAGIWYDVGAATTRTRVDYYDALSDRYNEAHTKPLADWAAQHDIALISNPLVEEDLGSHRLIEGGSWFEMSRDYQLPGMDLISGLDTSAITPKLNSSVAHVFDRPRNLAETFGAFGWDLTMQEMKRTVGWETAGGVDLIDNHAFYYSIEGQRAFESQPSEFTQNLFWPRFQEYAGLVGRLVEPARGATPVNPVGVLYPSSSVMATGTPWNVRGFAGNGPDLGPVDASWKNTSNDLLGAQLDFDYLDELALAGDEDLGLQPSVEDGEVVLGDQRWQAVVLPRTTVLSLEAADLLAALVRDGGTVVAVEGLPTHEAQGRDARLEDSLTEIFGADALAGQESRQSHAGGGLGAFLPSRAGLAELVRDRVVPGITLAPSTPDVRVRHVKRAADDAYLVVNLADRRVRTEATFDVAQTPELWDPENGRTQVAPVFTRGDGTTTVPLDLQPFEARWVVFRPGAHPAGRTPHLTAANATVESVSVAGQAMRARLVAEHPGEVYATGTYRGTTYGGKTIVTDPLKPLALDGDWAFRFDRAGAATVSRPLGSWTDLDPRYSGSGTYRKDVEVPAGFLADGRRVLLDLGAVRELAKVVVNGKEPRYLDWAPYVVDVTDLLRPGDNTIEVTVTNTQTNSIEGRANPSGLLGPAALRPQQVVDLTLRPRAEVTSYELTLDPASASVQPGSATTLTARVTGIAPGTLSGTVSATGPEGWQVEPADQQVSVESGGRQVSVDAPVRLTAPADAASGVYPVEVRFASSDGGTRTATATVRVTRALSAWDFDSTGDAEGWVAANQVTPFTVSGGQLRFSSTGGDPYLIGPQVSVGAGPLRVEVVMTSSVSGGGQVFWGTTAGGFAEARSATFPVQAGTATYTVTIPASDGELRQLRFDPVSGTGDFAVDAVRVLPGP